MVVPMTVARATLRRSAAVRGSTCLDEVDITNDSFVMMSCLL
jgi:hypothetical protein